MNPNRMLKALIAVVLTAWLATGTAWAASISWGGNGDPNNDGDWSVAANWSDNGNPAGDDITLPDVNGNGNSGTSTRTITVDSVYSANSLTINQTTAGFTNKLLINANLTVATTLTNYGTIVGNGTSTLNAGNIQLMAGSAISSVANINANTFSIRSTDPASFDLSGTTLRRVTNSTTTGFEVAASGTGSNFKIGTLTFHNISGTLNESRYRLVNDYANSGDQASEYFLVGAFNASGSWQNELDLNGQRLVIDGGVANYSGGDVRLSNRSAGRGVMEFRTAGGVLNVGKVGLSSGGTLEVIGPASLTGFNLQDVGTSAGNNGGTFKFDGNVTASSADDINVSTANSQITIDLVSANNTFSSSRRFQVSNGSTVTLNSHFIGSGNPAGNTRGLVATGTAKSGTGTPTIAPAGHMTIAGNLGFSSHGLSIEIGRDATLRVGGNYSASWWNGLSGAASRTFFADTSPNAGSFIFNGGGASVQTMEVLSKGYAVITGLSYFRASGTAPTAGQTVTGASSGATATIDFINGDILQLTGVTGTFQADEALNFSGGGTARAYDTQFAGLNGRTVSNQTAHLPIGTLSIGDPSGNPASVKLVNNHNPWGVTEDTQAMRNLNVTIGSRLDLNGLKAVVAAGNATISGAITSSAAAITASLELAEGVDLAFGSGQIDLLRNGSLLAGNGSIINMFSGSLAVRNLTLSGTAAIDWFGGGGRLFLNTDQTTFVNNLIDSGRLLNTGGNLSSISVNYDLLNDYTEVYFIPEPVPEPTTLALASLGAALAVWMARRRRR